MGENEELPDDNDDWIDNIALYGIFQNESAGIPTKSTTHFPSTLSFSHKDKNLQAIQHFLSTLQTSLFSSIQERKRFIQQSTRYFIKNNSLYK